MTIPGKGSFTGRFQIPQGATALVALSLANPTIVGNLTTLPALLLCLARREVAGTLTLQSSEQTLVLALAEGRALLRAQDRIALAQAFSWPEGSFTYNPTGRGPTRSDRPSLIRLAVDGVRALIHEYPDHELEQALGQLSDQAIRPRSDRAKVIQALALTDQERRFLELQLQGQRATTDVLRHSGLPRRYALQLLVLLAAFDCLEWVSLSAASPAKTTHPAGEG